MARRKASPSKVDLVNPRDLGLRIRAARVMAEVKSVEELARKLNKLGFPLSPGTLYAMERGTAPLPNLNLLYAISLITECGMDFFVPELTKALQKGTEHDGSA